MKRAAINAGHMPGIDSGAVGQTGLQEAIVCKSVAAKLCNYLSQAYVASLLIQEDDLAEICRQANDWGADIFVSLHCNSAAAPEAHGTEIYTSRGQTQADPLATCIMSQFSAEFPELAVRSDWADGDIDKEAGFYVLVNTDAPAVLIELAFISNAAEEAMLADYNVQDRMAAAIARGITDFFQMQAG